MNSALCYEFNIRSIAFERQKAVNVVYKDIIIKGQRIDLVVENTIIVEIKSPGKENERFTAQALSYLKATGLKTALIINFGQQRLYRWNQKNIFIDLCLFYSLCSLCTLLQGFTKQ